jgi:hypothetical protein
LGINVRFQVAESPAFMDWGVPPLTVSSGAEMGWLMELPRPPTETVCGELGASLEITRVAERGPTASGVKVRLTEHVAPGT